MISKFTLTVLVVLGVSQVGQSYLQQLVLNKVTAEDDHQYIFNSPVRDVQTCFKQATSYCTQGFWVVYDDIDFVGTSHNLHGMNSSLNCVDAPFEVKSARYGGAHDTDTVAISIYPEEGFRGEEQLVTGFGNALVTGKSVLYSGKSEWTLFAGQNFGEPHVCTVFNPNYAQVGVYGYTNVSAELQLNYIGSVVKGCQLKEVQRNIAFLRGQKHY